MSRVSDDEEAKQKINSLEELEAYQKKQREEEAKSKSKSIDGGQDIQDGDSPNEVAPAHKGNSYKSWSSALTQVRKYKRLNDNELTQMMFRMGLTMMPRREVEDARQCLFCHMCGDAAADGPARLLNFDVDKWVHLNCALWNDEVYETVSGALVGVESALRNSMNVHCKVCERNGASVKCFKTRCSVHYHVSCAVKDGAVFFKNKTVYCSQHVPKGEKDQELTTLAVYRRVYIDRDENKQVAKVMTEGTDQNIMRIGSLIFVAVGQLLPHQLKSFHTQDHIYPIGYKVFFVADIKDTAGSELLQMNFR